jgi:hypothetical protein
VAEAERKGAAYTVKQRRSGGDYSGTTQPTERKPMGGRRGLKGYIEDGEFFSFRQEKLEREHQGY